MGLQDAWDHIPANCDFLMIDSLRNLAQLSLDLILYQMKQSEYYSDKDFF